MSAPLRFLLLVIGGWIALRAWAIGEPMLGRFDGWPPVRPAAAPSSATAPVGAVPAATPSTPLETAAAAAAAAGQAAAAAARAADAAAVAAQTALVAAEVAAAVAGVPPASRAMLPAADTVARRLAAADRSGPWRQAAVHQARAQHFREQARYWRERAVQRIVRVAPGAGDWSLERDAYVDRAPRDWPVGGRGSDSAKLASSGLPPLPSAGRSTPDAVAVPPPGATRDRLRMTGWLLWRPAVGTSSLASGATLGDSQAGARLAFDLRPSLAASLRAYAPLRRARGGEVAAGLSWTPAHKLPLRVTAERRQRIGSGGGRSAFALFGEGGFYDRPLPFDFRLGGYAQGGVVGLSSRDLFVDGSLTFDRPLFGPLRAGAGVWGGAQPGASRLDVGPRLSLPVTRGARVDLDWRTRVAGSARPGSGPALTIAGDF